MSLKICGAQGFVYCTRYSSIPPPHIPTGLRPLRHLPGPCLDALRGVLLARHAEGQAVPGNSLERAIGAELTRRQRYGRRDGRCLGACWVCRFNVQQCSFGEIPKGLLLLLLLTFSHSSSSSRPCGQKPKTQKVNEKQMRGI